MIKLRVHVISSEVDPAMRDRMRRWLVHSPARVFADPEIVDHEYVITLDEPLTEPYTGEVSVARD